MNSSGAVVYADSIFSAAKCSKIFFKFFNKGTAGERCLIIYFFKCFKHFFFYLLVLSLQVKTGNFFFHKVGNSYRVLIIFAGTPATTVLGGTSLVTTDPAPIREFSPIVIPHKMVALEPMEAPFF